MPSRRVETGPTGTTVRERIREIRDGRGWSLAEVCRRLDELGRPLRVTALSDVENGARRVDVDDLVSIAAALEVSPITLMMPSANDPKDEMVMLGRQTYAGLMWGWLQGRFTLELPKSARDLVQFRFRSVPHWADVLSQREEPKLFAAWFEEEMAVVARNEALEADESKGAI